MDKELTNLYQRFMVVVNLSDEFSSSHGTVHWSHAVHTDGGLSKMTSQDKDTLGNH